jgi:hypothetical protein
MAHVGYEFLREALRLSAFAPERPALIKPVTRIEPADTFLAIPKHVAPSSDDPLEHTLFALKHEGVNLRVLAEALPKIDRAGLLAELRRQPSGAYIRIACCLWERITGHQLADLPEVAGPTAELFDPDQYVTGPSRRDARWRGRLQRVGLDRLLRYRRADALPE